MVNVLFLLFGYKKIKLFGHNVCSSVNIHFHMIRNVCDKWILNISIDKFNDTGEQ